MTDKPLFSEIAKKILIYLQAHIGGDADFKQIAAAINEEPRRVNLTINSALVNKGYAARLDLDGRKIIRLTSEGRAVNPNQRVDV